MKTLYLHIGWRKTGSSAIQSLVSKNFNEGLFFDLAVVPIGIQHQALVTQEMPLAHHGLADFSNEQRWRALWGEVAQFVKQSSSEKFLITSEMFSAQLNAYPRMFKELGGMLSIFQRVVIIFWVRPQDDFISSLYVQSTKSGALGRFKGDEIHSFPDGFYYWTIWRLEKHVQNATFSAHLYDRTSRIADQLSSAVDVAGEPLHTGEDIPVNTTVSPEMYLLQAQVNARAKEKGFQRVPIQIVLLRAWDEMPAARKGASAVPLTFNDRRRIIERFRESNRKLCTRFGFDSAVFEPPESVLRRKPAYNVPETIPRDFLEEFRSALELAREKWTGFDGDRLWQKVEQFDRALDVIDDLFRECADLRAFD